MALTPRRRLGPQTPLSAMTPAALLQVQRLVGNRAVTAAVTPAQPRVDVGHTLPAATRTQTVQRDGTAKPKAELPVPTASVETVRTRLTSRQKTLAQFLTVAKQDVANIRAHFVFVNGVYKRSFDHHALVVDQVKAQAVTKQAWVDFAFGVGVGVGVGLFSEALIAGRLAEAAYETLAEVGAELVEGGIARIVKPEVPKAELIPGLAPELKQIRSLQMLDDLNAVVLQLAVPGTMVFSDSLVQSERVLAELRLIAAGADADSRRMTDAEIRDKFAKITKFDATGADAETKLATTMADFDRLRALFFERPPVADQQVEQDIWIPWLAVQDLDTFFAPTVFNALMRAHLRDIGVTARLGVGGFPYRDPVLGNYWPHNPGTDEEKAVVRSYQQQKESAAAEAKHLPAFWNRVFLQP